MTDDHNLPRPAIYEPELPDPFRTAQSVAHEHLYDGFFAECGRWAAKLWAYSELVWITRTAWNTHSPTGEDPKEFILWLGEKYDLTRADRW